MESIPYRNTKLNVKTIPKGTLLFRLAENIDNDLKGVLRDDGLRCIIPNFNVFFYPNPFIAEIAFDKWLTKNETMAVYILKKNIKVLWLLEPSKFSRASKSLKRTFIKRCSTVKQGCMPKALNRFDPCISDSIIEKHPDIVGMIAVSHGDGKRIKTAMKHKTVRNHKYLHMAKDASGVESVPELILHPLTKRPSKDILVKEGDKLETNYELLKTFKSDDLASMKTFMTNHTVYDPSTYFFTHKE